MFSLSNSVTFLTNYESASSFLTDYQVVSFWNTIMTAFITVATSGGGAVKDLISAIYFLSSISSAYCAANNAGSAFLSSASASICNCKVSSFSFSIFTLCASMLTYYSSAFFFSFAMTIMSSSQIFYCLETSALLISDSADIFST